MAPSTLAIPLILLSALLHAIVNAIVKTSDDGLLTRGCMNAMAFAVAGLAADGETRIHDAECADVSFPGFWQILESIAK